MSGIFEEIITGIRIPAEDGEVRVLTQDEAREVMRDLFLCDDDEPRAMTDGYNEIRPIA